MILDCSVAVIMNMVDVRDSSCRLAIQYSSPRTLLNVSNINSVAWWLRDSHIVMILPLQAINLVRGFSALNPMNLVGV